MSAPPILRHADLTAVPGAARQAEVAVDHALRWLRATAGERTLLEARARRFGLTLGRALALALLVEAAAWSLANEHDGRARAAALRFATISLPDNQQPTAGWRFNEWLGFGDFK